MDFSKWKIEPVLHENSKRLALRFTNRPDWNKYVRGLNGVRWSKTLKAWHVKDDATFRKLFGIPLRKNEMIPELEPHIAAFKRWLRSRRYSENTIKTYTEALYVFLKFHANKPIEHITHQDVIQFNNDYIFKNKLSSSYQNQMVNAVKLFFSAVRNTKLDLANVHRPKQERMLPNVLSKQEVKAILGASLNIKHRAMLSLIYSCGLRRGELLNLKPTDIDSNRGLLIIRQAKGKKDRIAPLSAKTVEMLRDYYRTAKPKKWLFEGQVPGQQYDDRSIQLVLKNSLIKAGIKKPVTLHWLRHSYATHLLEAGTDLRYIQEILGHKSSSTTQIYTHVSTRSIQNIVSPFDDL
jgi:integrase/recombinase XerD